MREQLLHPSITSLKIRGRDFYQVKQMINTETAVGLAYKRVKGTDHK
jgi:hypothetical protein